MSLKFISYFSPKKLFLKFFFKVINFSLFHVWKEAFIGAFVKKEKSNKCLLLSYHLYSLVKKKRVMQGIRYGLELTYFKYFFTFVHYETPL